MLLCLQRQQDPPLDTVKHRSVCALPVVYTEALFLCVRLACYHFSLSCLLLRLSECVSLHWCSIRSY